LIGTLVTVISKLPGDPSEAVTASNLAEVAATTQVLEALASIGRRRVQAFRKLNYRSASCTLIIFSASNLACRHHVLRVIICAI
jgi:hypothetical protein